MPATKDERGRVAGVQNPSPSDPLEIVLKNCSREDLEDWIRELSKDLSDLSLRLGKAKELLQDAKQRGYFPQ